MAETVRTRPLVGIVMGSDSRLAGDGGRPPRRSTSSASRTRSTSSPRTGCRARCSTYGEQAAGRGLKVIVAGAGGAAHLPGMLASRDPAAGRSASRCRCAHLDGMDSLLSIVQMPAGVPVATVSVGGARNAGLLAVRILAAVRPGAAGADAGLPGRAAREGRSPRARRCAGTATRRRRSAPGLTCRPTSRCCAASTSAPSAGSRWPTCASCSRVSGTTTCAPTCRAATSSCARPGPRPR